MHERISVSTISFQGEALSTVIGYWRELQPRRVSVLGYQVLEDRPLLRSILKQEGYKLETITHPFLGFRPLEMREAWAEARESMSRVIDAAAELGARSIYTLTGGHGTLTWEDAADAFSEAIAPCAAQAKAAGISLAIENASVLYADNHIAHSLRDTVTLAERADINVCMDIFACWTEAGLHETIARAGPRLTLIQVSDYVYGDRGLPCRAVPGDGAIPLQRIFKWALDAGYAHGFDLELIGPRIEQEGRLQAVRRAAERVGEMLRALDA